MVTLLFAAVLVPHQPPAGPEPTVPVDVMKAAAATVRVTNQGTVFQTGSGVTFGVRDGYAYVLTANHVLGQDGNRRVEFFALDKQGRIYPTPTVQPTDVSVAARQVTADFAILKVLLPRTAETPTPPYARLAPPFERPKRFPAKVYSAGFNKPKDPENNAEEVPTVREATLIGKRFKGSGADLAILWETKESNEEGRSGGPLLDNEGRIIGICLAKDKVSHQGRFLHLDEIQAWMKKNGFGWALDEK
jgi:hypothetical protein